ncbi:MAG: AI-2E family transporter [Bulleidia sp.]|nr:AI-2E family transporter [Bulleidia sp.]
MNIKNKLDPKYTKIALYVIGTTAAIFILYRLSLNLGNVLAAIGGWLNWILTVLTPVFWGFMLAYLLKPAVDKIEKKLLDISFFKNRKKKPRTLAVSLTFIIIIILFGIGLSLLISSFSNEFKVASIDSLFQLVNYVSQSLQSFYNALLESLETLQINSEALQEYVNKIGNLLATGVASIGNNLVTSAQNLSSFITNLLFTIIFSIYFLTDGERIKSYWSKFTNVVFSEKIKNHWAFIIQESDRVFSGYIRGQLLDALFMFVVISVTLSIVGVKYAVIIGALAGFGNLIPYVGPFIAYGSTIVVTLVSGDIKKMVIAYIALFIVQTIDGNIINPKLLGNNVDVHPMLVVIALIIGQSAFGLLGMLFAVPVAALCKVFFEKIMGHIYETKGLKNPYKE